MARVNIYLNFSGTCEQAFDFYQKVFNIERINTQFYDDIPPDPNHPPLPADAKGKVMHTAIEIGNGTSIMGSDVVEGFGHQFSGGNSTYVMLDATSKAEAQELFSKLSKNSPIIEMGLEPTFFAELFSSFQDQFGIWWMVHFKGNPANKG